MNVNSVLCPLHNALHVVSLRIYQTTGAAFSAMLHKRRELEGRLGAPVQELARITVAKKLRAAKKIRAVFFVTAAKNLRTVRLLIKDAS